MTVPLIMVPEPVVALGVCAKVALVLMAARALSAFMRRSAAATRHRVWVMAAATVLGLVVLSPLAPRIPVLVPIGPVAERGGALRAFVFWLEGLSTLWALGAIAVGSWLAVGHVALARLAFRARRTPVRSLPDPAVREALRANRVRVSWSADVDAPLVGGALRPVLLVPAAAREWPAARLRAVLLHELAHVARGDLLAQALAYAVCTLFWFNPLAWHLLRRLREESECACDDRVLRSGVEAADYAADLLSIARASRRPRLCPAAAGMASPSHLEGRVRAILDPRRARTGGRGAEIALLVASLLVLLPLASLRTQLAPRASGPQAARVVQGR